MQAGNGHGSESHRTRLVGSHDLQGREALQVILQGDWCFVGHLPGEAVNPLTGKNESNGTSILDVSNPAQPKLVAHIPSEPGANCRAVQVVKSPRDGKTYIARNHEAASGCTSRPLLATKILGMRRRKSASEVVACSSKSV